MYTYVYPGYLVGDMPNSEAKIILQTSAGCCYKIWKKITWSPRLFYCNYPGAIWILTGPDFFAIINMRLQSVQFFFVL